jgi:hypothetical protein
VATAAIATVSLGARAATQEPTAVSAQDEPDTVCFKAKSARGSAKCRGNSDRRAARPATEAKLFKQPADAGHRLRWFEQPWTQRVTRPTIWVVIGLATPVAGFPLHVVQAQASGGGASVPFELVGGRPHIQVYVNGKGPFAVAFDTGAQGIGRADSLLVSIVGLPTEGSTEVTDGITSRQQATVRIDSLRFGPVTLHDVSLPSRRYGLRIKGGAPLMGILGPGFFADYTFTIDYPRSEIRVTSERLSAGDSRTVPYTRPFRIPFTIGTAQREAHVDTGFGLGIHIPLADTVWARPDTLMDAGVGETTQNRVKLYRGRVSIPLIVAGNHLEPIDALFTDQLPDIVLGAKVLQHFVVSIDQRSRLVRIAPPNDGDTPP